MSSEGWGVSRGRGTESRPLHQRLKQSPLNILAASSWKASLTENSIVFQIFYENKNVFLRKIFWWSIEAVKIWRCKKQNSSWIPHLVPEKTVSTVYRSWFSGFYSYRVVEYSYRVIAIGPGAFDWFQKKYLFSNDKGGNWDKFENVSAWHHSWKKFMLSAAGKCK